MSDFTLYATGIPREGVTTEQLTHHFNSFGKVQEATFSFWFGKLLKKYMKQDKLNKKIRLREVKINIKAEDCKNPDRKEKILNDSKLKKLMAKDDKME